MPVKKVLLIMFATPRFGSLFSAMGLLTMLETELLLLLETFLHLHPIKLKKSGAQLGYTWCMGGLSFFVFLALTVTGVLLMFYYRPTAEYAYNDIIALREHVPLGIMREIHRWGAHLMVITVWLHMFRVFMTGSYKPPREFNWGVGVILLCFNNVIIIYRILITLGSIAIWAITVGSNMAESNPFFRSWWPWRNVAQIGDFVLVSDKNDVRSNFLVDDLLVSQLFFVFISFTVFSFH